MKKIVILDGAVANSGDLSWENFETLGDITVYDHTPPNLIIERAKDATVIITNKCPVGANVINQLPNLKCICLLATGYNIINVSAAKANGIVVCNAVNYSTPSVAQHVFALLLHLTNHVALHNQEVHQNGWANRQQWAYWQVPILELSGKTLGLYGLGNIGSQVAKIGLAFGMKVIATRKNKHKKTDDNIKLVNVKQLFAESDVLSLHAPLTIDNQFIINKENLSIMKSTAFLINTGRGGLVNESDLKNALINGQIAGAALDVLNQEPPALNHPLLGLPNCIITPHQAWLSTASRQRLLDIVAGNVKAFLDGKPINLV